jgi:hypothetical protein
MDATDTTPDTRLLLAEALADASAELQVAHQRIHALEQEVALLKKQLAGPTPAPTPDGPYSLKAEEQRQHARGRRTKTKESKKQRRGRIANEEKLKRAEKVQSVYPEGVPPEQCRLSHVRAVWRLIDGRAVLVAYQVFRGPKKRYGVIPGVLGRSEYGLEIVVELAFLAQQVGLSFDKLCLTVDFLQNLKLGKSQVEALLKQLAEHWSEEFEVLCTLLANSLVVHTDETRWSLNSVWAFLSEKARVLFYGVHKDAATLKEILDPATFRGTVFSDDAAVYGHFTHAQKCWAHLLRKAIKLTLQAPGHAGYRAFTDELLLIYRDAKRAQRDRRLGLAGRNRREKELLRRLMAVCGPVRREQAGAEGLDHDWWLLAEELIRLAVEAELFTFLHCRAPEQPNGVTRPLDGTNNEAERKLRGEAQARATGRTSKTLSGARRTTVLGSVLESLRLYLPKYTLGSVIDEVRRWQEAGRSCFRELLDRMGTGLPGQSVLDRVLPQPSG